MHQLPGSAETVVLVVVVVVLEPLYVPLLIRSFRVQLFSPIVSGSSLDQPVLKQDTAAVGAIATETTVFLFREIQESFVVKNDMSAGSIGTLVDSASVSVVFSSLSDHCLAIVGGIVVDSALGGSGGEEFGSLVEV